MNPIHDAWSNLGAPHPFATFAAGWGTAEKRLTAGAEPAAFAKDGALFWHGEFKRGVSCELYAGPVAQAPVAWLIDWPDEPDRGHYIAESPADIDSGRSRALVFADAAPVAGRGRPAVNQSLTTDQPSDADIIGIAVAQSLVCHDHGDIVSAWREDADIRAHVLAFARALLARYRAQAVPAQQLVSGADGLPADIKETIRLALIAQHDAGTDQTACDEALNWLSAQPQPSGNAVDDLADTVANICDGLGWDLDAQEQDDMVTFASALLDRMRAQPSGNAEELRGAILRECLDPQTRETPVLDKPAKVGAGRFGVGVKWSSVIAAAQRLYEREVTPEKEAERIQAWRKAEPLRHAFKSKYDEAPDPAPPDAVCFDCQSPAAVSYSTQFAGRHDFCAAHDPGHK